MLLRQHKRTKVFSQPLKINYVFFLRGFAISFVRKSQNPRNKLALKNIKIMRKTESIFVGKGHQLDKTEATRITIKWELLAQLVYQFQGEKLITLDISEMKKTDKYGRTHTVYGKKLAKIIY